MALPFYRPSFLSTLAESPFKNDMRWMKVAVFEKTRKADRDGVDQESKR
jgi:hypothetical protein